MAGSGRSDNVVNVAHWATACGRRGVRAAGGRQAGVAAQRGARRRGNRCCGRSRGKITRIKARWAGMVTGIAAAGRTRGNSGRDDGLVDGKRAR